MEELELARAFLKELEELLPALLSRCQQVDKLRKRLLGGAKDVEAAKAQLAEVERERDDLRRYVLDKLDECGGHAVLHDVRVLVRACETLDDKLLAWPVAKAVPTVIRTFATRRRQLLQELKGRKSLCSSLADVGEGKADSFLESHRGHMEVLARHLARLSSVLKSLDECNAHLQKVRAASYVARFEDTRASLQNEKDGLKALLEDWCQSHQEGGSKAWADHGELVTTLLAALEVELDGKLVAAIRQDIGAFTKEFLPRTAAVAPVLRKSAGGRPTAKKMAKRTVKKSPKAKTDNRVELDFQVCGAGLS